LSTEHTMRPGVDDGSAIRTSADRGVAALGTMASLAALFSAAACCILPLGLAAIGVGAAGLSSFVPFHWPLTIAAIVAVAAGWIVHLRKRQACARDATCMTPPPAKSTFILLSVATVFVTISACWGFIEAPLMRMLGGA
jgi:mercuric ion transport protein